MWNVIKYNLKKIFSHRIIEIFSYVRFPQQLLSSSYSSCSKRLNFSIFLFRSFFSLHICLGWKFSYHHLLSLFPNFTLSAFLEVFSLICNSRTKYFFHLEVIPLSFTFILASSLYVFASSPPIFYCNINFIIIVINTQR